MIKRILKTFTVALCLALLLSPVGHKHITSNSDIQLLGLFDEITNN